MKRWYGSPLVFALIAIIFLVGKAEANLNITCDESNQRLFSISSLTNAHAEDWNGTGGYDFQICYYNFFRAKYSTGDPQPHSCHDDNVILRISGSPGGSDAHVEGPDNTTTGYSDICFGDLSCFLQAPGRQCNITYEGLGGPAYSIIVSVDGDTNTHPSLTNISERNLCCKSTSGILPQCDYDGVCESPGETPMNCPDCMTRCGDGTIQGVEECDCGPDGICAPSELGGANCTNYDPNSPFAGGMLSCFPPGDDNACQFNYTGCTRAKCSDGLENDADGAIDINDFSCLENGIYLPGRDNESFYVAQCQNGRDDDGDGKTDYGGSNPDSGCTSLQDNSEANCGDNNVDPGESCDCGATGGALCNWTATETCNDLNEEYRGGTLWCDDSCEYNFDDCEGYPGFCEAKGPFLIDSGEGIWLSPSSCQDYNEVYPEDESKREELCLNDCVVGASDPVNNGYGGVALMGWGCGWDNVNKECYFYFNSSTPGGGQCRLDYTVTQDCGPDNPFRTVLVTAGTVPPSDPPAWNCAACESGSTQCETQIMCPRVVQLPFIGAFGLALAAIIIALVYVYIKRKK